MYYGSGRLGYSFATLISQCPPNPQVIYYATPLSTFAEVIRTRSAASLYPPMCVANTVNGAAWAMYGVVSGPASACGLEHTAASVLHQIEGARS